MGLGFRLPFTMGAPNARRCGRVRVHMIACSLGEIRDLSARGALVACKGRGGPGPGDTLPLTVAGLENLNNLEPPVIFAANHTSYLDVPAIYTALPFGWRQRLAPAMMKDHFRAYFEPQRSSWRAGWIRTRRPSRPMSRTRSPPG